MAAFSDAVSTMDVALLAAFGIAATLHPQAGGSVSITGIVKPPAIEESYLPGGSDGVNIVRFFVRFVAIAPNPRVGDTVTINAVVYDIADVDVDSAGGAVLKLKRNA